MQRDNVIQQLLPQNIDRSFANAVLPSCMKACPFRFDITKPSNSALDQRENLPTLHFENIFFAKSVRQDKILNTLPIICKNIACPEE